jgi:hypothetical protein
MRAEPQDFQSATPTGFAEQTAHPQEGVDRSQIHVCASDRIDAAHPISSGWDGRPAPEFRVVGDPGRIVARSLGRLSFGRVSFGRMGEIPNKVRASVTVRSSSVAAALVVAFGLGWGCSSIFNSNPDATLITLDRKVDLSLERTDSEAEVRRHHGIANAAVSPSPAPAEPNKPKPSTLAPGTRVISSAPVQVHAEPQSVPSPSMQERTSPSRALSASGDSTSQLPLSPVPETKPTTIAGWTVREVYGDKAVLVGPDHVWTVRTGDTVPGVGRIDTIVRWGGRWIVATTAGLISTE